MAGLILVVSLALKALSLSLISAELEQRLFGGLLGLVVVASANVVPKAITPLARARCNPATEQSLRRFTGWSLVIGGAGYGTAALFVPLESSLLLGTAILGASVVSVIGRCLWVIAGRSR
ncbi:MAG: hypothetical protein ACRDL7_04390 [Gaiellaceae bacterium]